MRRGERINNVTNSKLKNIRIKATVCPLDSSFLIDKICESFNLTLHQYMHLNIVKFYIYIYTQTGSSGECLLHLQQTGRE